MRFADLQIRRAVLSDFQENAFVVSVAGRDDCVVVDPGMEPEPLIQALQNAKLQPKAILVTHGHWDHVGGIAELREIWPDATIFIGENESWKLTDPNGNLSAAFGFPMTTCAADRLLKDGETFDVAGLSFKALEIPGHSRGHVVYLLETDAAPVVFCGDVVFSGSVGRSDFPDGNAADLVRGIREKILTLPDAALLFPGHGPKTTVGAERKYNPFLQN